MMLSELKDKWQMYILYIKNAGKKGKKENRQ